VNDTTYADDVCIVSYGCVLPHASNPDEYWHNILQNRSSIAPLPESRWKRRLFYSPDRSDCDASYSYFAAVVEEEVIETLRERFSHLPGLTRLQLLALESARQALATTTISGLRASLYLGCMSFDESTGRIFFFHHQKERLRQCMEVEDYGRLVNYFNLDHEDEAYHHNSVINSSILFHMRREFGIDGFSTIVDAACASSIVAIGMGMNSLRKGESDCVVVGGVDSSLGPESFIVFCRAGVMAEKSSIPFSTGSEGLMQGEGAVMFVLKRLSDAVASGDTIHGIIRGAGFSSNGRSSSLFQLSVQDQILAYERAYAGSPLPSLDFIEAHATGTLLGDDAELRSLQRFFRGQHIALSSTKAMSGHTKAAAGAASLLKALLIMKHREIPPFLLSDGSRVRKSMPLYIPRHTVNPRREIIHAGVSSFGFGGINSHLHVLSHPCGRSRRKPRALPGTHRREKILLVGESCIETGDLETLESRFELPIPVKSLPQVERMQRLAVIATERAFHDAAIAVDRIDREQVGVICGAPTAFEVSRNLVYRLYFALMNEPFEKVKYGKDDLDRLRGAYPPPTKDTGPGMLKNVIAGRVANHFNFKGISCAVDYDLASGAAALSVAMNWLSCHGGFMVVIGSDDVIDLKEYTFQYLRVNVHLLSTLTYARRNLLPIISVMREVSFIDR